MFPVPFFDKTVIAKLTIAILAEEQNVEPCF